jgi:putative ABC transport system ATP-binding protein
VIAFRRVNHHFGEGEARKQTLFEIETEFLPGELAILSGPSGSGKTTLLTLAGALRRVQEGEVVAGGRALSKLSEAELVRHRRGVGFIFQLHNLFPALTAVQNVRMALELTALDWREQEARARALLERLGLGERLDYRPQRLSGGQRQRVAIARALAGDPGVVLADEPTAALDRDSVDLVLDLLAERAHARGATVLVVTHDARVLDRADRILNLVDGRIASDVRPKAVERTCELLRKVPLFSTHTPAGLVEVAQRMRLERHAEGATVIRQGDPGDRFYVLAEGAVEVLKAAPGEAPRAVDRIEGGGFFGEAALLTGAPRNAMIRTLGPSTLLSLGKEDFLDAVRRTPSFEAELRRVLGQRGG